MASATPRRIATIDIGTNTTLLLVAEARGPDDLHVLADRAEITRLGRGIGGDGRLGSEGIERTLAALRHYASIAREHGAEIAAIGTEGLRRAPNASDFLVPAAEILGSPVDVIDGGREAALTFLAAARSFPTAAARTMTVIDIGGGSTEIIVAHGRAVMFRESLPLGSVRLTEKHVRNDPPTDAEVAAIEAELKTTLAGVPFPSAAQRPTLVGIAGTVTTLAAMAQDLRTYDSNLVHGYQLGLAALEQQVQRLRHTTQKEREGLAGLDPRRADVILAGACVLLAIVRQAGVSAVTVSDRGIRWGLLFEKLAS